MWVLIGYGKNVIPSDMSIWKNLSRFDLHFLKITPVSELRIDNQEANSAKKMTFQRQLELSR